MNYYGRKRRIFKGFIQEENRGKGKGFLVKLNQHLAPKYLLNLVTIGGITIITTNIIYGQPTSIRRSSLEVIISIYIN